MLYGYLRTLITRICMGDKLSFKRCQALRLQVISVFRASQISFRLQVYRLGNLAPACDMARLKARFRRALNKNTNRFVKLSLSLCGHDAYWSTVDPNGSRCCWAHKFLVVEVVCCLEETRRLSWESWSWTRSPASFIPRRILSTLAESLGWVGSMESSAFKFSLQSPHPSEKIALNVRIFVQSDSFWFLLYIIYTWDL